MSAQVDSETANSDCVGPASEQAGKAEGCAGCPNAAACAAGAGRAPEDPTPGLVRDRLAGVKHVLLVLSGKGGVGKSTVSCQLAMALAEQGKDVGLLDIDICGPSVPRMLGLKGRGVHESSSGWSPVYVETDRGELGVMSVGFMLPDDDNAVIWRGPRKNGLIKQFLTEVDWGDLDFLVIDTPPGTSDEHISIAQYLKLADIAGAIVVTTPQEVSMQDVRKELNFCVKTKLPVLGVVENMARLQVPLSKVGFVDRATGEDQTDAIRALLAEAPGLADLLDRTDASVAVFQTDDGSSPKSMADAFGVPYLGALPLDPVLQQACDAGKSLVAEFPHASALDGVRKRGRVRRNEGELVETRVSWSLSREAREWGSLSSLQGAHTYSQRGAASRGWHLSERAGRESSSRSRSLSTSEWPPFSSLTELEIARNTLKELK